MLSVSKLKNELSTVMESQYSSDIDAANAWSTAFTNYYKDIVNPVFSGMTVAQAAEMQESISSALIGSLFGSITLDMTGAVFAAQLSSGLTAATTKIFNFGQSDTVVVNAGMVVVPPTGSVALLTSLTGIFATTASLVAAGESISIEDTSDLIASAVSIYTMTGITTSASGASIPWDASLADLEAAEEEEE